MTRFLSYFNVFGVIILAAICAFQWKTNRNLNLEVSRLEKSTASLETKISDKEKEINGITADLDTFREQIQNMSRETRDSRDKFAGLNRTNNQLTIERDQLKESVKKWSNALAERDQLLKETRERLKNLAKERNDIVAKHNATIEKYNQLTEELNTRTKNFNDLVERYNKLAESKSSTVAK